MGADVHVVVLEHDYFVARVFARLAQEFTAGAFVEDAPDAADGLIKAQAVVSILIGLSCRIDDKPPATAEACWFPMA
jgi:hypothetical protein